MKLDFLEDTTTSQLDIKPDPASPLARLLSDPLRGPVEQLVSRYFGAHWQVRSVQDLHDLASHPAAILSDGLHPVFVKLSEVAQGLDQFEAEIAGLRLLSERAGILTPAPIGLAPAPDGVILVLEAIQAEDRRVDDPWREIGRTLARIHLVQGESFGLDRHNYFGPLYQDNRPTADWPTFFLERRLWPRFTGAIDSGSLPSETIHRVEAVIRRIPRLDLPASEPCLLHGDAQKNNFISTARGAAAVDPAVYYGHPEMDLAYLDIFEPVPEAVFSGYQEIRPIDPGWRSRKELWRLPAYLALVAVGGTAYLDQLLNALHSYL